MRIIIIIIATVILATSVNAYALSDLEYYVMDHNQYCEITSAGKITGEPEIKANNDETNATYKINDSIHCIFGLKNDSVSSFMCVCLSDNEVGEFLAQCITACYSFCGMESGINAYDPILYNFLLARGGQETEADQSLPGVSFIIGKEKFGYYFILTRKVE